MRVVITFFGLVTMISILSGEIAAEEDTSSRESRLRNLHAFTNNTDKPAKLLITLVPAALENMFFEVGEDLEEGKIDCDAAFGHASESSALEEEQICSTFRKTEYVN